MGPGQKLWITPLNYNYFSTSSKAHMEPYTMQHLMTFLFHLNFNLNLEQIALS